VCVCVIISRCLYSCISNFLLILPKLLCSRTSVHVNVNYSPLNMLKLQWLFRKRPVGYLKISRQYAYNWHLLRAWLKINSLWELRCWRRGDSSYFTAYWTFHDATSDISVYSITISKILILKLCTTFKICHGIPCTCGRREEDICNILHFDFLQFRQLPYYIAKKFPAFHGTLTFIVVFTETPLQVMWM